MGRLARDRYDYALLGLIVITAFTTGWILKSKPTEERPTDIPPFGLACVEDIRGWSYIQKPSGQLALSPTQLARVFCSIPAVHSGYKNGDSNAKEHAQETIKAISAANRVTRNNDSTE